ncbi:MAG: hemolysin family protein [Anaerolineales bacterium]
MIDLTIGLTAFVLALIMDVLLAASRSAFVNSRLAHLRSMDETGVRRAAVAIRVLTEARRLILSLRIGQTTLRLATLGLALLTFLPAGQYEREGTGVLVISAIVIGTGLVIALFEFVAENIVLRSPERWAVRMAPVVNALVRGLEPIGWLLLRVARWISNPSGDRAHPLVTEEAIMTLVDAGEEEGVIEEEEKAMIYSIFQLDNTLAREVMVPRIDILAFEAQTTLEEATETLLQTGHSRAPVFRESIDNIVGLVYIKDLLASWRDNDLNHTVGELLREAYFVPEAKKVDDLLAEMQAKRVHMSVVVDEYGGTAGVVTIEDIVEEIVGEILDEYDFAEEMPYEQLQEGEYIFSGGIDVDDVNQIAGSQIPKETSETLGGYIYSQLGKVPIPGEVVEAGGLRLVVEQVVGRRIRKVRAILIKEKSPEAEQDDNFTETEN